jgi:hypothetical protein
LSRLFGAFFGLVNADLEEKEGELPEADKIRVSSAGQEKQEDRTSDRREAL